MPVSTYNMFWLVDTYFCLSVCLTCLCCFFLQLEDVMEKETYKKAKEILEKFDPARFKKLEVSSLYTVLH